MLMSDPKFSIDDNVLSGKRRYMKLIEESDLTEPDENTKISADFFLGDTCMSALKNNKP
jgi:hypothetical protein